MSKEPTNRAPSFQFYPDKWQSDTRRLSDSAYRVYQEMMCWMWLNSPDYSSIPREPEEIAYLLAIDVQKIVMALGEIQNKHFPLLKGRRDKLMSVVLKKESVKQIERRCKARDSANSKWKKIRNANGMRSHETSMNSDMQRQCSSSSSPSPSPECPTDTPPNPRGGLVSGPVSALHLKLVETGKVDRLSVETVEELARAFPRADMTRAIERFPRDAIEMPGGMIQAPRQWLKARFSELEVETVASGDGEAEKKKNAARLLRLER